MQSKDNGLVQWTDIVLATALALPMGIALELWMGKEWAQLMEMLWEQWKGTVSAKPLVLLMESVWEQSMDIE